jgi:signal transduction histidine kinase/ActR/RegA family two-component response regulator
VRRPLSATRRRLSRQRALEADNAALLRLHELSAGLVSKRAVPELLQAAVDAAVSLSGADKGTLQLYDAQTMALQIASQRGFKGAFLDFFKIVRRGAPGSCEGALHSRDRVIVEDVTRSPLFAGTPAAAVMARARVRAVQSTPLVATDGRLLGVCSTHWRRPHRPAETTLRLLDLLCRQVADLIQHLDAEETLRRTEVALRAAVRRKDEFISILSHELRNPLTPILASLEVLRLDGRARGIAALAVIERQARHMARLVDDLLDVSRITQGRIRLVRRPLSVRSVVAKGLEMAASLLEERGHTLDVLRAPADLRVDGDEARLSQMVANLVINAAKYTPAGGHVAVRARREGPHVVLEVEDDGVGIRKDLLPHVFDLFVQGRQEPDRAAGGLGVGLTIVRSVAELHGGLVFASSEGRGQGAVFTVRLPAAVTAARSVRPAAAVSAGRPRPGRRILVVDDNADVLAPLVTLLERAGHEVHTATSGPAAIKLMKRRRADVAVLDIGLPGMDGYQLAARLRARRAGSSPRLIALTGYGEDSDRARSKRAGFAAHIAKPFEMEQLLEAIDRLSRKPRPGRRRSRRPV